MDEVDAVDNETPSTRSTSSMASIGRELGFPLLLSGSPWYLAAWWLAWEEPVN